MCSFIGSGRIIEKRLKNITHDAAICCNPPIHNFRRDRKDFTDPQETNM
jgi:hypothetical protein